MSITKCYIITDTGRQVAAVIHFQIKVSGSGLIIELSAMLLLYKILFVCCIVQCVRVDWDQRNSVPFKFPTVWNAFHTVENLNGTEFH